MQIRLVDAAFVVCDQDIFIQTIENRAAQWLALTERGSNLLEQQRAEECQNPKRSGMLRLRGMRRMTPRLSRLRTQIRWLISEQLRTRVVKRFGGWKSATITGREGDFREQMARNRRRSLDFHFPATLATSACMLRNRPVSPS